MTILSLSNGRADGCRAGAADATFLRTWLADRWAILFSHPEDFAHEELETDRWTSILSRSFSARGVTPLALARPDYDTDDGWLGRLAALNREFAAALALDPPLPDAPADFSAAVLRAHIARSGPRFAMIIDSNLRCRRTLSYRSRARLPSPLDLIGWAVALRKRDSFRQSSGEIPEPSLPLRPVWAVNRHYAVALRHRALIASQSEPPPQSSVSTERLLAPLLIACDDGQRETREADPRRVGCDREDLGLVVVDAARQRERGSLERNRMARDEIHAARARIDGIGEEPAAIHVRNVAERTLAAIEK